MSFESLDVPEILTWIVTVAIPAVIAFYKSIKASKAEAGKAESDTNYTTLNKLMSADVPMDDAQQALLDSGKVSDKTWRMSSVDFNNMAVYLNATSTYVKIEDLQALVDQAEMKKNVDYGIIVYKKDGTIDQSATHVYVSYGIPEFGDHAFISSKCRDNNAVLYPIYTWWRMSDRSKQSIKDSIGTSYPECIAKALNTIAQMEAEQRESYTIACNNRYWEIYRGNIVNTCAGADGTVIENTQPAK